MPSGTQRAPNGDGDLIWIQDAAEVYGKSRKWLEGQTEGDGDEPAPLSRVTFAGDKRVWLRHSQIAKLLHTPHETRGNGGSQSQAG